MKRFRGLLIASMVLVFLFSSVATAAPRDDDEYHKQTKKTEEVRRPEVQKKPTVKQVERVEHPQEHKKTTVKRVERVEHPQEHKKTTVKRVERVEHPQEHRKTATVTRKQVIVRDHRTDFHGNWHRQHAEWNWFGGIRHHNVKVYRHSDRISRIHFEHYDFNSFYEEAYRHHGHYSHRDRYVYHGIYGWAYYWFTPTTVIRAFVTDEGYVYTTVWDRSELEACTLELGYGDASHFGNILEFIRIAAPLMDDDD